MAAAPGPALAVWGGAAVLALACGFVGAQLAGRGAAPPLPAGDSGAALAPVIEELRALRRDLAARAAMATTPAGPAAAPPTRQPLPTDATNAPTAADERLLAALEALTARVDLLAQQRLIQDGVLHRMAQQPGDHAVLAAACAAVESDRDGFERSLWFLGMPEILRRFGTPTDVRVSQRGRLELRYDITRPDGESDNFTIAFYDGCVISVWN
ncbi:MAG: hypothetical protein AB7O97_11630 [Planctomycetota bacterium]